jgi:hypothetical protein
VTPAQRAYEALMAGAPRVDPGIEATEVETWEELDATSRDLFGEVAQAVLSDAFPGLKRELAEAREKLAVTRATAREVLAAYESGTVVSDELAGIWRERLGGDHA